VAICVNIFLKFSELTKIYYSDIFTKMRSPTKGCGTALPEISSNSANRLPNTKRDALMIPISIVPNPKNRNGQQKINKQKLETTNKNML
jgi:hypothetical protein